MAILRQVHSDRIVRASRMLLSHPPQGDGWVSAERELLIAVQTADCIPLLLVDPKQRVVAAVHAGWRGTLQRIGAKAVRMMQTAFGSDPCNLLAVVGPAIRSCCYEVGEEVVEAFRKEFEHSAGFFCPPPKDKATRVDSLCIDLVEVCRRQLLDAGVMTGDIFTDGPCTACEKDRFFSHRSDSISGGRMMSVIGIVEAE